MAEAKKVIVTGIPGSGSTDFCNRYSTLDGLRVKTYNMADILLNMAQGDLKKPPITAENLLNLHPELLRELRDEAFGFALLDMAANKDAYERLIIDMHSLFFWNDVLTNAWDWSYLRQIDADIF